MTETVPEVAPNVIASWPESRRRWQDAPRVLGGGVSTGMRAQFKPHPLYFTHGAGSHLFDVDGNEYVDYVLGWGPDIIGHAHPALVSQVTTALRRGQSFGACYDAELQLARTVLARTRTERLLWTNTGSEATQIALRLARAATGRSRYVKFRAHYHGWSDSFLYGYRPDARGQLDSLGSRGQSAGVTDDVVLVDWGDADGLAAALDSEIAAVFCEPVLCNTGVIEPPDGFLQQVHRLCAARGAVLVFDEVITGFRIARGGAIERYGVQPDLVVLAKALGGGLPLAAVAGRATLIDQVTSGVVHAGTYNGNLVAIAGGFATLRVLDAAGVYDRFEERTALLRDGFADTFASHGVPAQIHNVGPVLQIMPDTQEASVGAFFSADWAFYDRLAVELLRRGVFCLPGGRWYLSTEHTEDDIARTVDAMSAALPAAAR